MMTPQKSIIHSHINARDIRAASQVFKREEFNVRDYKSLEAIGIKFSEPAMRAVMDSATQSTVLTQSLPYPVQFLQTFLPGTVRVLTAERSIDTFVGRSTVAAWEDEQVVQPFTENVRSAVPYGDTSNVPLSSWLANYAYRTVVRFEMGISVTNFEAARASRVRIDDASEKRLSASESLEISRNLIGFNGYNNGANQTYGFLNDPNLPAYTTVPVGASGSTLWSRKTLLEIINDIRNMIINVRTRSQDRIDPINTDTTLALPTSVVDQISQTSDFGYAVKSWLSDAYPRMRVESAVQLNGANGGANVGYLYAENVDDGSSDGGMTFMQCVPVTFMLLGVQQLAKGYIEDYVNATAGVFVKRPYAVERITGI